MKRISILLCCILVFQLLVGCVAADKDIQEPVNFYYINKDISYNAPNGVISSEIREGSQFHDFEDLLRVYLAGPISSELQSFVPVDTSLMTCDVDENTAYVLLSEQFAKLSGVKLTIASSAILLTANESFGIQTIRIQAENAQLDDKEAFVLTMDDIILTDATMSENIKE